MTKRWPLLLAGIVIFGLAVRLPGVFWGTNFPGGWRSHHPDEFTHWANVQLLFNPDYAVGSWRPHPYPKGLAAMVGVPAIAVRKLHIKGSNWPDKQTIITAGRLVSVAFGTATIVVVVLMANLFFDDRRIGLAAGLMTALGGLHVTQSHFFVSDVAGIFWLLLGLFLLLKELKRPTAGHRQYLGWAAFCMGAAFGMKLIVAGIPTMGMIVLLRRPRIPRIATAIVFFVAGFVIVNAGSYTPHDLLDTIVRGIGDPYVYNRLMGMMLYLVELPSVVSLPLALLAVVGGVGLMRRSLAPENRPRLPAVALIVVLPILVQLYFVAFTLDHFPRHLVPFVPWLTIAAAWILVRAGDGLRARGIHPLAAALPLFLYLTVFVVDGERVFLEDPRNEAATWVMQNVPTPATMWWRGNRLPDYEPIQFPVEGRPFVLVMDMKDANHYVSGIGWRDSYPSDARNIFDSIDQEWVVTMQDVFRGASEYHEAARFREGYFMPEYTVTDRLIGNRSRNYVAEIVIFTRDHDQPTDARAAPPPEIPAE